MHNFKEMLKKVPKWVWFVVAGIVAFVALKSKGGGTVVQSQFPSEGSGGGTPSTNEGSGGAGDSQLNVTEIVDAIKNLQTATTAGQVSLSQQINEALTDREVSTVDIKAPASIPGTESTSPRYAAVGTVTTLDSGTVLKMGDDGYNHVLLGSSTVGGGDAIQNGRVAEALFSALRTEGAKQLTNTSMTGSISAKPPAPMPTSIKQGSINYDIDAKGNISKNGRAITVTASNKSFIPQSVIDAAKKAKTG